MNCRCSWNVGMTRESVGGLLVTSATKVNPYHTLREPETWSHRPLRNTTVFLDSDAQWGWPTVCLCEATDGHMLRLVFEMELSLEEQLIVIQGDSPMNQDDQKELSIFPSWFWTLGTLAMFQRLMERQYQLLQIESIPVIRGSYLIIQTQPPTILILSKSIWLIQFGIFVYNKLQNKICKMKSVNPIFCVVSGRRMLYWRIYILIYHHFYKLSINVNM